ncbi:cell division protein FtsZ [Aciduliprofundum sp. MAR08-339]|uniref:cell division protein FtsZ n=1 Tax=Aciduliprofundum sp. (strain MAR08-339) TaxID=673860 RepID=UPI0002A49297|nr:cell division protein FtsZ [Aciduliprofundum sp. MAR08-339]
MKSLVKEVLSKVDERVAVREEPTITSPDDEELLNLLQKLKTNIKVVGCGGAGSNTINRIMEEGIVDVELIAANTDAQHLLITHANRKILLGRRITRGLGAGALPQVGEEAAREVEDRIREILQGADIVFITCGLGGGTGTGSAPVVAQIAKEIGALTIAICTLPFTAEGRMRFENAMWGLEKLKQYVDTVITIPNDKLLQLVPRLPLNLAFKVADEILMRSIKGLAEMITKPGLVNLDFNDLKTIMKGGGVAMIGLGESDSENRAEDAIKEALNSPLIEADISEATGALINVVGGENMTVKEAESVAEYVQSHISKGARIIWGASIDPALGNTLRVMVVITGVKSPYIQGLEAIEKNKEVDVIR